MAVFIICLCMLACVVLVELEVHLIHTCRLVVVLCSVQDQFLTQGPAPPTTRVETLNSPWFV